MKSNKVYMICPVKIIREEAENIFSKYGTVKSASVKASAKSTGQFLEQHKYPSEVKNCEKSVSCK